MPQKGKALVVAYEAFNTNTKTDETGDVGNHTIQIEVDGTLAVATNTPTEVSSSLVPGIYQLTLTKDEMNGDFVVVGGVSTTPNVLIRPIFIIPESPQRGNF